MLCTDGLSLQCMAMFIATEICKYKGALCTYVCIKFFNVNNRTKLKTCLQPGSQSKIQ